MGKMALLFIVVVAALIWFRFNAARQVRREDRSARPRRSRDGAPERMVACAICGLHLPANEAVADAAGRNYCGVAHRDAARH
jgi:uncharacterized protein